MRFKTHSTVELISHIKTDQFTRELKKQNFQLDTLKF